MRRLLKIPAIIIGTVFLVGLLFFGGHAHAQDQSAEGVPVDEGVLRQNFYLAKVIDVVKEEVEDRRGITLEHQIVKVRVLRGDLKGKELEIDHIGSPALRDNQRVNEGDGIVILQVEAPDQTNYYIVDKYRLPSAAVILALFFGLVIFFSRRRGAASILGLVISVFILTAFVVPRIAAGENPLIVGFLGALVIAVLSLYTAHGFNRRTSVALASTLLTLGAALVLALVFVSFTKLFGTGSEEAFYLQLSPLEHLNLRGLLLAGIVIGALGILDDITTSQSAAVEEIQKANPRLSFTELYKRGISVGKEHISSLVNTLVLAYAGASLPLFLLFSADQNQPLWVLLNSESIMEEVVRTLVGSTALVLAVPISTFLAAYIFSKQKPPRQRLGGRSSAEAR